MQITVEFLDKEINGLEVKERQLSDSLIEARSMVNCLKQLRRLAMAPDPEPEPEENLPVAEEA